VILFYPSGAMMRWCAPIGARTSQHKNRTLDDGLEGANRILVRIAPSQRSHHRLMRESLPSPKDWCPARGGWPVGMREGA